MTKKILLKWLSAKKAEAILEVEKKRKEAQKELHAQKLNASHFDELIAYVQPRLNEVWEYVHKWHEDNKEICGDSLFNYGGLHNTLYSLLLNRSPMAEILAQREFSPTKADQEITNRFRKLQAEVEAAYDDVAVNVNSLANAKLGMDYLEGLGFDLSELKSADNQPVETALTRPIDRRFLFAGMKNEGDSV